MTAALLFACLLAADDLQPPGRLPPLTIDRAALVVEGIRLVDSPRLLLLTDVAAGAEVDGLPGVVEQALPRWCAYFGVKPARTAKWRLVACLMKDRARFVRTGLLPPVVPAFAHGFSWDERVWLFDQPTDYYRRHLLLHEGVHSFMNTTLGGCGPLWYMEGIAELLATHRLAGGRLIVGDVPARREDVEGWGRVFLVRQAWNERRAARLEDIVAGRLQVANPTEAYGWHWAAAAFFDRHPRYQARFRQLPAAVGGDFAARFNKLFADRREWAEEWRLCLAELDYGYDFARMAIDFAPGRPIEGRTSLRVAADRGWQNTGLRLAANTAYTVAASGRYQVAAGPPPWTSEPGGVSIRYHRGRPLGMLLAAVRPDEDVAGPSALEQPIDVGLAAELRPQRAGTLFLRINDAPAELRDNAGTAEVVVEAAGH